MSLIFGGSTDHGSFKQSSRIIAPLLHWLFPNLSDEFIFNVVFAVRKCSHLAEYAILALLVWRARRRSISPRRQSLPWQWPIATEALWVAIFYATTDEFHQTFIPSREGCLRDVCVDSTGAIAGIIFLWLLGTWRKWWPDGNAQGPMPKPQIPTT